jgi:CRP-like cAMP-binding protein
METLEFKLSEYCRLNKTSVDALLALWQKSRHLKPKESLIDFDQTDSNLYYIESGFVRLFVVDDQGGEKNIGFGYANTFITSFQSFITGNPSLMSIEAISETKVISITRNSISQLIAVNPEIACWYQSIIENTLAGHIQRQIELLTLSPQERYAVFLKRSGKLINAIPLKHIASYLMITPETLSRVRAKIS